MITIFDIFYLLFFVQGILLGIWTVARDKPTPWRFVGVVAALAALVCLQKIPGFDFLGQVEQLALLLLLMVIATSLSLFVARAAGVRITRVSRRASSNWGRIKTIRRKEGLKKTDSASTEPPKLQFSLWSLMSWTTAFAVLLSSLSTWYIIVPWAAPSSGEWLKITIVFLHFFADRAGDHVGCLDRPMAGGGEDRCTGFFHSNNHADTLADHKPRPVVF